MFYHAKGNEFYSLTRWVCFNINLERMGVRLNSVFCVNSKKWCKRCEKISFSGGRITDLLIAIIAGNGVVVKGGASRLSWPLTNRPFSALRHSVRKVYCELRMYNAPILPSACPFFSNIHHGKIKHFEQAVIRREYSLWFCDFAELPVKAFNGICGIYQPSYLLRIFEVSTEINPVSSIA